MIEIKRYSVSGFSDQIEQDVDGDFVFYDDYADLEAQLAEAQERIKELEGALDTIEAWSGNDAYIEIELIKLYAAGQREGAK